MYAAAHLRSECSLDIVLHLKLIKEKKPRASFDRGLDLSKLGTDWDYKVSLDYLVETRLAV